MGPGKREADKDSADNNRNIRMISDDLGRKESERIGKWMSEF
jgi:hypothetical protein